MLAKDRVLLRNLIIAVVAGSGAALAIGTSCLGRDRVRPEASTAVERERDSVRSSAGGIPASPAGTTTITSAENSVPDLDKEPPPPQPVPALVRTYTAPPAYPDASVQPTATAPPPPPPTAPLPPAPPPASAWIVEGGAPPITSADGGAPPRAMSADGGAPPTANRPAAPEAGPAPVFRSEPPPFSASPLPQSPDPSMGAGPFITDPSAPPAPSR